MDNSISDIHSKFSNINKKKLNRLLYMIKYRYNKYGSNFGIGKRDGDKVAISTRQMSYIISYLIENGYLVKSYKSYGTKGFLCNRYKLSDIFLSILKQLQSLISNCNITSLQDRINEFNISISSIDYVKSYFNEYKVKPNRLKLWVDGYLYIVYDKIKQYKGTILDVSTMKIHTLFSFINYINNESVFDTAKRLKLIG